MPKQIQGLFKKSNSRYWYADFTDASGTRVKRSTRTVDHKEAEALLAKWKLEAQRQTMWDEEPSHTYDDLMLRYLQGPSKDKRAHDRDLFSAKRLTPFFQGRALNDLGPADVQEYIDQRRDDGVGGRHREQGAEPAIVGDQLRSPPAAVGGCESGRRDAVAATGREDTVDQPIRGSSSDRRGCEGPELPPRLHPAWSAHRDA
jgi:hypothetical protein